MKLKRIHVWAGVLAAIVIVVAAGALSSPPEAEMVESFVPTVGKADFSYDDYAAAFRYVNDQAMVNYRALKADRGSLDAFAAMLEQLDPKAYDGWSEKDRIAFWTNAYNALTLKAIIDNYPIRPSFTASLRFPDNSIRQIKGVWDKLKFPIMGRHMTLDDIEHRRLRRDFGEPRIHLALVCAAMGCPPLRNEPFVGEKLEEQFADQAHRFLGDPKKLRLDRGEGKLYLSSIFKWFGGDFVKTYGTNARFQGHGETERAVLNYIAGRLDEGDARYLDTAGLDIEYLDYDWSLNEQATATK